MPVSTEDKLRETKRSLEQQKKISKKWFDKVQRIHNVVERCGVHLSARGGSKPGNVMGVGGLGAVSNLFRSVPPENNKAEQALMEIIKIIEED